MRYRLVLLLSAVFLAAPVWAEEQPGKRGDRLARMQEHLQLTDAQMAEMRSIRENGGSRKDMHAVLTDSQRVQMKEHRAHRKGMRKGERRGMPGEQSPQPDIESSQPSE